MVFLFKGPDTIAAPLSVLFLTYSDLSIKCVRSGIRICGQIENLAEPLEKE